MPRRTSAVGSVRVSQWRARHDNLGGLVTLASHYGNADTLRNDIAGVKAQLAQRSRDIDILVESDEKILRMHRTFNDQVWLAPRSIHCAARSVEATSHFTVQSVFMSLPFAMVQIADIRHEVDRVGEQVKDAAGVQSASEATHSALVAQLQAQVGELLMRTLASEQRAEVAERAARDASAAAQRAQEEAAEVRGRLESVRNEVDRRVNESERRLREVEGRMSGMAVDVDGRFVSHGREMDGRLTAVQEMARDLHAQATASFNTGLASLQANVDKGSAEALKMSGQVSEINAQVSALRQSSGDAATALATDVAMLADQIQSLKGHVASETTQLSARIKSVNDAGEQGRKWQAEEVERRIGAVNRRIGVDVDDLKRSVGTVERSMARIKESFEDTSRNLAADSRATNTHLSAFEGAANNTLADVGRRLDETVRSHGSRLDALASAVHAFANVLNLGQLIIDPKAVAARAGALFPSSNSSADFAEAQSPYSSGGIGAGTGSGRRMSTGASDSSLHHHQHRQQRPQQQQQQAQQRLYAPQTTSSAGGGAHGSRRGSMSSLNVSGIDGPTGSLKGQLAPAPLAAGDGSGLQYSVRNPAANTNTDGSGYPTAAAAQSFSNASLTQYSTSTGIGLDRDHHDRSAAVAVGAIPTLAGSGSRMQFGVSTLRSPLGATTTTTTTFTGQFPI